MKKLDGSAWLAGGIAAALVAVMWVGIDLNVQPANEPAAVAEAFVIAELQGAGGELAPEAFVIAELNGAGGELAEGTTR